MASENSADIGRSVTATWLSASHPAEVPSSRVENHAARAPNSSRRIRKKSSRNRALHKATGRRGARSASRPRRNAAPVIQ